MRCFFGGGCIVFGITTDILQVLSLNFIEISKSDQTPTQLCLWPGMCKTPNTIEINQQSGGCIIGALFAVTQHSEKANGDQSLHFKSKLILYVHLTSQRHVFESWAELPHPCSHPTHRNPPRTHMCALPAYTLKLSPHPHFPFTLGLLKVNSLESSVSSKSMTVPTTCISAMGSTKTVTPVGFFVCIIMWVV